MVSLYQILTPKQADHDGPGFCHLSHFLHKWILHLCSFGSNLWPSGWDQFWSQGDHMNKVYKEMLHAKNLSSIPSSFRRRILKLVFFVPMFQLVTPGVGPVLNPRGIIWIKLTKAYKEMLHTKNQSSIPSSFREEEFWSWSFLFLCSNL